MSLFKKLWFTPPTKMTTTTTTMMTTTLTHVVDVVKGVGVPGVPFAPDNSDLMFGQELAHPYGVSPPTAISPAAGSQHFEGFYSFIKFCNYFIIPVMIVTGIVGNIFTFLVFVFSPLKRLSTSVFLAALAFADAGFLLALGAGWVDNFRFSFFQQRVLCTFIVFATYMFSFLSVWFVVCFTTEMYLIMFHEEVAAKVSHPHKARLIVCGLTVVAGIFYLHTFWTTQKVDTITGKQTCAFVASEDVMMALSLADSFLTLLLPFSLLIFMNTRILIVIVGFARTSKPKTGSSSPKSHSSTPTSGVKDKAEVEDSNDDEKEEDEMGDDDVFLDMDLMGNRHHRKSHHHHHKKRIKKKKADEISLSDFEVCHDDQTKRDPETGVGAESELLSLSRRPADVTPAKPLIQEKNGAVQRTYGSTSHGNAIRHSLRTTYRGGTQLSRRTSRIKSHPGADNEDSKEFARSDPMTNRPFRGTKSRHACRVDSNSTSSSSSTSGEVDHGSFCHLVSPDNPKQGQINPLYLPSKCSFKSKRRNSFDCNLHPKRDTSFRARKDGLKEIVLKRNLMQTYSLPNQGRLPGTPNSSFEIGQNRFVRDNTFPNLKHSAKLGDRLSSSHTNTSRCDVFFKANGFAGEKNRSRTNSNTDDIKNSLKSKTDQIDKGRTNHESKPKAGGVRKLSTKLATFIIHQSKRGRAKPKMAATTLKITVQAPTEVESSSTSSRCDRLAVTSLEKGKLSTAMTTTVYVSRSNSGRSDSSSRTLLTSVSSEKKDKDRSSSLAAEYVPGDVDSFVNGPMTSNRADDAGDSTPRLNKISKLQRKSFKMLLTVAIVFLVLNLPSHAIRLQGLLRSFFTPHYVTSEVEHLCQQLFQVVYYLNFTVNFVIYNVCAKSFRTAFLSLPIIFSKSCRRRKKNKNNNNDNPDEASQRGATLRKYPAGRRRGMAEELRRKREEQNSRLVEVNLADLHLSKMESFASDFHYESPPCLIRRGDSDMY